MLENAGERFRAGRGGHLVTHRWDVEPHEVMKLVFPLMRPVFVKQFQTDLDQMVERIAALPPK